MADGKLFVNTLKKLGCPNSFKLYGCDVDWMFDISNLQPFLSWFCESLDEKNVLTDSDLLEFDRLTLSSSDVILDGELLDKCLTGLPKNDDNISIEKLRKEVTALNNQLKSNETHLNLLRQHRDIFQIHQIELSHQVELLQDNTIHIKHNIQYMQQKFLGLQNKLTSFLQLVILHIQDFTNIFKDRSENNLSNGEISCPSFAHVDLHIYLKTEDQLLYQLKDYIKLQLNRPFIDQVCSTLSNIKCELVDFSSHDSCVNFQRSYETIKQNKAEVNQLHRILQETEEYRIKEFTTMAKEKGKLKFLEAVLEQCCAGTLPNLQTPAFECESSQLNKQIIRNQTILEELLSCALPNVIEKSIQFRSSVILTGDFESKLARQEAFINKQEMILDTLLKQHARWKFLLLLLFGETCNHKDVYKLLAELHDDFDVTWKKLCYRKEWMTQLQENEDFKKEIDSNDFSAHDVMSLLGSYSDKRGVLFLTYNDLEQASKSIGEECINLQSYISASYAEQMQKLCALEECFNQWYYLVYGNQNLETNTRASMSPFDIDAELSKLHSKINALEKDVKVVAYEIEKKKKIIKANNYTAAERKIFVYFYTSPENLQKIVSSLLREVEGEKQLQRNMKTESNLTGFQDVHSYRRN